MFLFDPGVLMDFISSIAIIAILGWAYASMRMQGLGREVAPSVLGLAFGLVAVLQMHAPFSPISGLVIDMRAVPVVLAGAFLGRRGMVACLVVALAGRWHIGGVGMVSGMMGIVVFGVGGLLWDRLTRREGRRPLLSILGLALPNAAGLFTAILLPNALSRWFFLEVAVPLFLMSTFATVLIAVLLERERIAPAKIAWRLQQKAAGADEITGFLALPSFVREVANRSADGAEPVVAILAMRLRHSSWLQDHIGEAALLHVLGGVRHRLAAGLELSSLIAMTPNATILLPLTGREAKLIDSLSATLRRLVSDRRFTLPDGKTVRLVVSDQVVTLPKAVSAARLEALLEDLRLSFPAAVRPERDTPRKQEPALAPALPNSAVHPNLFAKAAVLFEEQNT